MSDTDATTWGRDRNINDMGADVARLFPNENYRYDHTAIAEGLRDSYGIIDVRARAFGAGDHAFEARLLDLAREHQTERAR